MKKLIPALIILLLWFYAFPLNPPFSGEDIFMESAYLLAALGAYFFILGLRLQILEIGWSVFIYALLIDLLDEFTKEPKLWNTIIQGFVEIAGLATIAAGLYVMQKVLRDELARSNQAQKALLKSQAQYADLVENANDAILTFDPAGNITSANRVACVLLGYTREEALGKHLADVLTPDAYAFAMEMLRRGLTEKSDLTELQPWKFQVVRKDGSNLFLEVRTRLIWEERRIVGVQAIARDMTQRKQAEAALRRRDAILEAVGFAAEQFLRTTDWTQNIHQVLARLGEATGVSRVYIFESHVAADGRQLLSQRYEWAAPGITPQMDNPQLQNFDWVAGGFARWVEKMRRGEPVYSHVRELSEIERGVLEAEDIKSILGVPIFVRQEWWGWIGFDECLAERDWSAAEIDALKAAADTLGAAIERHQINAQAQERLARLGALHAIDLAITATPNLQERLDLVLQHALTQMRADIGSVFLAEPETNQLHVVASLGLQHTDFWDNFGLKFGQGGAGWIAQHGEPLAIPDVRQDSRWDGVDASDVEGIVSYLGAPLRIEDRLIGVIDVATRVRREFTAEEIDFFSTLAGQVAVAFQNARLFDETQRRAREFAALYDIARELAAQRDLPTLLQTIVERATLLLGSPAGAIYLYDAARGEVELAVTKEVPAPIGTRLKLGEGAAGRVAQTRQPLIVDDYQTWEHRSPQYARMPFRAVVQVPMLYGGELIGVMSVNEVGAAPRKFTSADAYLLSLLAAQAASAVYNARLLEDTQRRADELAAITRVSREITSAPALHQVFASIARHAAELARADASGVFAFRADGCLEIVAGYGVSDQFIQAVNAQNVRPGQGTIGRAAAERRPVQISDVLADPDYPFRHLTEMERIRAMLAAPMLKGEEVSGGIVLWQRHPYTFSSQEVAFLQALAQQCVNAVENARLFEQAQQRAAELEAVRQATLSLTTSLKPQEVLDTILENTLWLMAGAQDAHIFLYHPDEDRLTFGASLWSDGDRGRAWSEPRSDGLTFAVARTGQAIVVPDMSDHPLFTDTPAKWKGAIVGLPLKIGARVVGVMNIAYAHPRAFAESDLRLLRLLGDQAAIAIENARLFEAEHLARERADALREAARAVSEGAQFDRARALDLDQILRLILEQLKRVLTYDTASVLLFRDAGTPALVAGSGYADEKVTSRAASELLQTSPILKRMVRDLQPITIADVREHPDWIWVPGAEHVRSFLGVPIIAHQQMIGALMADSTRADFFTEADVRTAQALAQHIAVAIENARLFEEARQRALEQSTVSEIARALSTTLDVRAAFPAVVQGLRTLTGCERVSVALLDESGEHFTIAFLDEPRPEMEQGARLPLAATSAAADVLANRPHSVPDLSTEMDYPAEKALYEAGYRSRVNLPLVIGEQVIGTLNLASRQPNAFTYAQLPVLQQIAGAVATAIENTRLLEAEQMRRSELAALYDLSRGLGDIANDPDAILNIVVRHAVETLHVTFARVLLVEDEQLVTRTVYPPRVLDHALEVGRREPAVAHPFCLQVLQHNAPIVIQRDDPRLQEAERAFLFLDLAQTLCLTPLCAGDPAPFGYRAGGAGRIVGLLTLGEARRAEQELFTPEKTRLARSIGDQMANALHRAALFAELERAYLQTVLALAQAVDAKDTYTADHSQRLAAMALAVGREMGLDARELEDLRYGAILHDIGKIGVPDAILQKPVKLTRADWTRMRHHPVTGAQILAPVPRLAGAARIVRHHHERYDGRGYPDGLSGEAIPLGARILNVVDSYSAIRDKRVYKKARPHEEAVKELKKHAGAQFDPQVVQIFLRLLERGIETPENRP